MKKRRIKIGFIILIMLGVIGHTVSLADVGSFDRYDSGGSSWSSGFSGSSSGGFDSYDGGYHSSRTTMIINELTIKEYVIIVGICITILGMTFIIEKKRKDMFHTMLEKAITQKKEKDIDVERIKERDANFSEEDMLFWAKELFVKLQNAWTARDWEPMRPFETESLFEQHKLQVQGYIDTNRINVMDQIAVDYVYIYRLRQEGDRDILEIALKSTMKDYIMDATTKQVLEGNKTQDRVTVYKMTFERKIGVLTPKQTEKVNTINCPNCGAPTKITSTGKCEYCRSILTIGANTWVLSGIEPLKNK